MSWGQRVIPENMVGTKEDLSSIISRLRGIAFDQAGLPEEVTLTIAQIERIVFYLERIKGDCG